MAEFKKYGRDIYLKLGYVQAGTLYDARGKRLGVQRGNEFFLGNFSREPTLKLDEKGNILDAKGKPYMDKMELKRAFDGPVSSNEILPLAAFLYLNRK